MRKYGHGGDKYGLNGTQNSCSASAGLKGQNSCNAGANLNGPSKIVDFSANTNPLGMPENVKAAARIAVEQSGCYPDPFCRELTEKICHFESQVAGFSVPGSWVVCGNGAADLIFRSVRGAKMKEAMVLAPTFSEYEQALIEEGVHVHHYYLKEENGFQLTEDFLEAMTSQIDGIFLCNPNNPVGNFIQEDLMRKILKRAKEKNILLFVDECFLELTGEMEQRSLVSRLKDYDNLVIFKAFTKTYAMAGLRLGYLLTSNETLADKIFNIGQPWSVSTPAQMAGIAAIDEREYVAKSVEFIVHERSCLQRELEKMGFQVYPGRANYIFFYHRDGKKFRDEMRKRGILVRDCENYQGLFRGYMRIAVGNKENNRIFLENAWEVLKWLKV